MDERRGMRKEFIGYEYKEVLARSSKVSFLLDGYECFGWEPDENRPCSSGDGNLQKQRKAVLCLRRDRKIINKMELTRLQRNFEACVNEIESLENARTSVAVMYALSVGIIGTAFMAGSVFAVTAEPPRIVLSILLAIPAFLGWSIPYFLYRKIVEKQTEKLAPLIEKKYDEIYEICEKGNKLTCCVNDLPSA